MERSTTAGIMLLALMSVSCGGPATMEVRRPGPRAEPGPPRPGDSWFARQRMSSGERIPRAARSRALARWRQRPGRAIPARAPGVWTFAGPSNIGGRLTSLAVDPHDPDHIWAGAAAGGVFESNDGGATWTAVFDDQPLLPVGAVAAHPADSGIVYVGTGEANGAGYSYDGEGVFRTTDGGSTWQPLGLTETRRIGRIAIDALDPQRLFVAAAGDIYTLDGNRGVYRSLDGGATWTRVLFVADSAGAIDVVIDPSDPARVYAAIWDHHSTPYRWYAGGIHSGIWRSTDGGDTWSRLAAGLPAPSPTAGRIGLAAAPSSPGTLYALHLDDPGRFIGVYKTLDGGDSWFRVDPPGGSHRNIFGGFGYYFGQIRVDPADADRVFLLDVDMSRSADGGVTWSNIISGIHVDHHDLAILPGRLYVANDAGFYRSADNGITWTRSASLPVTQFYDLAINPQDPDVRFGGTQDTGSIRTRTGGASNWTMVLGGDGMQCEVDPIAPQRVYCEAAYGWIHRSSNSGNTFSSAINGIPQSDRRNWNAPLTHDPAATLRLYTGTYRVFRSTDGAQSWLPVSGDLTAGTPAYLGHGADAAGAVPAGGPRHDPGTGPGLLGGSSHLASTVEGTLTTIAVSRIDTGVLWAASDYGHVWVSQDDGASWSRVDVPGRTEWVTRIEADPFSREGAYVTFSGYRNASALPRIFRTADLGRTWADISADLPDVPLNCVTADPAAMHRGRLFVCTDLGVFVTSDHGASWSELGSGLPRVVVHDLDLVEGTRELFAGTHARSIYRYDLAQLGPADADGDGALNDTDCAPGDPGAFAAPGEVGGLAFLADGITLQWDSAAPAAGTATAHQVLRGVVGQLPVDGGPDEVCAETGTAATSLADPAIPPLQEAWWYLVRAVNACGTGSYGTTSAGPPRASAACP